VEEIATGEVLIAGKGNFLQNGDARGGPSGYRWAGKHAVGDKRITFLAETFFKL
jgi:hypothetical protein